MSSSVMPNHDRPAITVHFQLNKLERGGDDWVLKFGKRKDKVREFAFKQEEVVRLTREVVRLTPNKAGDYMVHFGPVTLTLGRLQWVLLCDYLSILIKDVP